MRRRHTVLGCTVLLAACLAAGEAGATSARRASLLGNFLVLDDTDVFLYPGALPEYAGGIFLDLDATALDGNGGFIAEKGVTFGAFFHRPDPFLAGAGIPSDFEEIDALYPDIALDGPFKLFDLLLAFRTGAGSAFGLGLSFAHSFQMDKIDGTVETGDREMSLALTAGYSSGIGTAFRNDLGIELRFNHFKEISADETVHEAKPIPSFSVIDRMIFQKPGSFAWGLDLIFSRRDYSAEVGRSEGKASRYVVGLRIGPRLTFADRGILVAASLQALYDTYGGKVEQPSGPDEPMGWQHNFLVPGFNLATEITVFDWLLLRAAFDYVYLVGLYRYETNDPVAIDLESVDIAHRFVWSTGLGVRWKGIGFDAVFSAPLFQDGPDFIGGRGPGLFTMVSLSYTFI